MEKFTFKYKLNKWVFIISPLILLLMLPTIIICALRIAGVGELFSLNYFSDIVVIIICAVILVLLGLLVFNSRYVLTEKFLYARLGFFSNKIAVGNIKQLDYYQSTQLLIMVFKNNQQVLGFAKIFIEPSEYDDFIKQLVAFNNKIELNTDEELPQY